MHPAHAAEIHYRAAATIGGKRSQLSASIDALEFLARDVVASGAGDAALVEQCRELPELVRSYALVRDALLDRLQHTDPHAAGRVLRFRDAQNLLAHQLRAVGTWCTGTELARKAAVLSRVLRHHLERERTELELDAALPRAYEGWPARL